MPGQFDDAVARRDLARYHRRGPDATTRALLSGIRARAGQEAHLLDIGAGIGVLHHELLGTIIASATHVEAAPAYITVAREEATRRAHGERVTFLQGDAVGLGPDLPSADVVTLDRVVCCYPDWEGLARLAAGKARSLIGVSLPRDRWYVRTGVAVENMVRSFRGNDFRTFVHPVAALELLMNRLGFNVVQVTDTFFWHVVLGERERERHKST